MCRTVTACAPPTSPYFWLHVLLNSEATGCVVISTINSAPAQCGVHSRSGAAEGAGASATGHTMEAPLRQSSPTAARSVSTAFSSFFMVATYCRSGLHRAAQQGCVHQVL